MLSESSIYIIIRKIKFLKDFKLISSWFHKCILSIKIKFMTSETFLNPLEVIFKCCMLYQYTYNAALL